MKNLINNKKTLLIVVAIAVFVIVLILTALIFAPHKKKQSDESNSDTSISSNSSEPQNNPGFDRDTGEKIETQPTHATPYQSSSRSQYLGILGSTEFTSFLYKNKLENIEGIYESIEQALTIHRDEYSPKTKTVTLRPNTFTISDKNLIRGEVRLGQTDVIIPIEINFVSNKDGEHTAKVTIQSNENSTVYVGGLYEVNTAHYSIKQQSSNSSDLTVSGSDKEAALRYITSLGYTIPDLKITFANYRSPFE